MNQRIGNTAKEEIRKAMTGLVGASAKTEAQRQADLHNISVAHVYDITRDVRGDGKRRKKRSDAGKRKFELKQGTDVFEAAALVIGAKLDPDQALITAKVNGHTHLPTLGTFQKMLREHEVNRKQLRSGRRNHRSFEAKAPLDIVQIDSSALKVRWLDYKTRRIIRIEGIDKNHPQLNEQMLRVWQIVAVDDHTRRRYVKYLATNHITSKDIVSFCCDLFCEWGLPRMIYSDNGPEFQKFFAQAVRIIQSIDAVKDSGGFEHKTHAPGNAQASGKVEIAHQWVEKMNKYIGLATEKGLEVTDSHLQGFSNSICRHYNEAHVNRSTGQTPIARWHGQQVLSRMLQPETLRAALLFEEATRTLTAAMTVRVGQIDYRIPARDDSGKATPFKVGMKLTVIAADLLEDIFVTLPNGEEYTIPKQIANPDVAGEYRSAAQSQGEHISKALNDHYKQKNREAKELKKLTGEVFQVPHFNREIEIVKPQTNVIGLAKFKHPEVAVTSEELGRVTPVPMDEIQVAAPVQDTPSSPKEKVAYVGRPVGYWKAVAEFGDRFESKPVAKAFLTDLYAGRVTDEIPSTEIEAAIDRHFNPQQEVAQLRIAS